jgi:eukaryotic-like serine/threonine-protein kinase
MFSVARDDDTLDALLGVHIPSDVVRGVTYRTAWRVGTGPMSIVFYALRVTANGESPVVVKVLRPSFVHKAGPTAALMLKKEAIALGRLNERVPPTPFVVRFIDAGTFSVAQEGVQLHLPWLVIEYVHGGSEGTTLGERVTYTMQASGVAFEPNRAAHALECLSSGLMAVHDVGVLHRDLKPDNVLCCGFGDDEIFKIADFGVARPAGIATFSGVIVGTPGFVAPELVAMDPRVIGPWSDIFSLGAVLFYVLTGEELFAAKSPGDALVLACSPTRRSILEARGLSPELRAREQACRAIDHAISVATSIKIEKRPRRADALAAMMLPWLRTEATSRATTDRLDRIRDEEEEKTQLLRWSWTTLKNPTKVLRSVAWDGDGKCMAATSSGLSFWNGAAWSDVPREGFPNPTGVRFVQRVAAGTWLVGGDDATFATYTSEGVKEVRRITGAFSRFERLSGDLDDLAVLVGSTPGGPPTLCALSGKRWLKPLPLPDVSAVTALARLEDARWLLAGRHADGRGFAAIYAPLDWDIQRLGAPEVRAFLAASGQWTREIGLVTGADGAVLWCQGGASAHEIIDGGHDLSAASVDAVGRGWAASAGRIWLRRTAIGKGQAAGQRWDCIWHDATWTTPIVSLFTDLGVVVALTADGSVVEGRALDASSKAAR